MSVRGDWRVLQLVPSNHYVGLLMYINAYTYNTNLSRTVLENNLK